MRDVLERRFGLKGGKKATLEAIGKEYKITRERVRQIEADALKQIGKDENIMEVRSVFSAMENYLRSHGEVMALHHFLDSLGEKRHHPHIAMLVRVGKAFTELPESDIHPLRVALGREKKEMAEAAQGAVVRDLEEKGIPVTEEELKTMMRTRVQELSGDSPSDEVINAYVNASKRIAKNPYGEYGLASWSSVNPRGVRDKAYSVLAKAGNPLHFREVAKAIDRVGWSKRKAHHQTVHNELIKDSRFVLVGRGLYALREWGYETGVVRDVVASVLKSAGKPLTKDEIIRLMSKRRFVKPQTVLLNLQNKELFRKTEDGRFTIV